PVIDLTLPADVTDGYLSVSIVDVSGSVFHLVPRLNRPESSIDSLRAGQDGAVTLRLVHSTAEAQGSADRIAFNIDPSSLGKSQLLAIVSDRPLFETMRPRTESAASFAEALKEAVASGGAGVRSLDSAVLTSVDN